MASISSVLSPNFIQNQANCCRIHIQTLKPSLSFPKAAFIQNPHGFHAFISFSNPKRTLRICAQAQEGSVLTQDPTSDASRRLYVGNIPRTVDNSEITRIFSEHGSVAKAEMCLAAQRVCSEMEIFPSLLVELWTACSSSQVMYDKYTKRSRRFAFVTMNTVEDANAAIEKLNGSEIGGRQIKVNITEKPLQTMDLSLFQAEESKFIDSPHKVYVGNLAKTVTSETLTNFFSERGKVLSARVSRVPGTSKSSGFGFVSFSSDEDVEAAISSSNNAFLDGQRIRVNKG